MSTNRKSNKPSAAKRFAAIEEISILGITERMGPLALHLYAEHFLGAAEALPEPEIPFEPVRPYLVCHAVELSLKAYLSLTGELMLDLANAQAGHKLDQLLTQAESAGLLGLAPLSDDQREAIRKAETYYAGKVFEYPAVGEALSAYPHMPPMNVLRDAANLLVTSLAESCKKAK